MKTCFIIFFILIAALIFADHWTYEMQTIELPIGNSDNEIQIYAIPDDFEDIPDEGPIDFRIDEEGNIYILDGELIKKFHGNGIFLSLTSKTDKTIHSFVVQHNLIWAVCGNHQNQVFLRRFSEDCQLIDTHPIENRKSTLAVNQNGKVGMKLGNNNFLEFNIEKNETTMIDGIFLNDAILEFSARERKQKVYIPEENIELDLNDIWPNEIGHSLIGFDESGNLYFNRYSEPGQDSSLGIISNSGEVIESNIIFPHYTKFGLDFARGIPNLVTPDGIIYQMIPMPDKIEIRKWTKVHK